MKRALAAIGAVGLLFSIFALAPEATLAKWTDSEYGHDSTFQGGTVAKPTGGNCTAGLAQSVNVKWTNPTGGLTRDRYRAIVTLNGSQIVYNDAITASSTNYLIPAGLLSIGNGTFTVQAVHASGWTSTAISGTFTVLLAPLITGCTMTVT